MNQNEKANSFGCDNELIKIKLVSTFPVKPNAKTIAVTNQ